MEHGKTVGEMFGFSKDATCSKNKKKHGGDRSVSRSSQGNNNTARNFHIFDALRRLITPIFSHLCAELGEKYRKYTQNQGKSTKNAPM